MVQTMDQRIMHPLIGAGRSPSLSLICHSAAWHMPRLASLLIDGLYKSSADRTHEEEAEEELGRRCYTASYHHIIHGGAELMVF